MVFVSSEGKPRFVLASALAPLPAAALAAAVCLIEVSFPDADSTDDTPRRAAAMLLALLPLAYLCLGIMLYLTARVAHSLGKLSRRFLLVVGCLLTLLFAGSAASTSPYGLEDAFITFGLFAAVGLTGLLGTVLAWWRLAAGRSRSRHAG